MPISYHEQIRQMVLDDSDMYEYIRPSEEEVAELRQQAEESCLMDREYQRFAEAVFQDEVWPIDVLSEVVESPPIVWGIDPVVNSRRSGRGQTPTLMSLIGNDDVIESKGVSNFSILFSKEKKICKK